MTLRIALIGYGGIATGVAAGIRRAQSAELVGAVVRTRGRAEADGVAEISLEQALEAADLIVECAGVEAVRQYGPRIVSAGRDLLIVSVGALADSELRKGLLEGGPGRLVLTNGAIGGLDLLAGAAQTGGLKEVALETRKLPGTLVQPWMDGEQAAQLGAADGPVTVFRGNVTDAIDRFPQNLNVAVALAHSTGMWQETSVHLVADPQAQQTQHVITASGSAGSYRFQIRNTPLRGSSATSGVVIGSVLSGIRTIAGVSGVYV